MDMKLFGFDILDPISIETILKENEWKYVWAANYNYWSPESKLSPHPDVLSWLQTVPAAPPVISKVSNGINNAGIIKIWIRPEDYVLFVLKFS